MWPFNTGGDWMGIFDCTMYLEIKCFKLGTNS